MFFRTKVRRNQSCKILSAAGYKKKLVKMPDAELK
jgi:hypothetical protein